MKVDEYSREKGKRLENRDGMGLPYRQVKSRQGAAMQEEATKAVCSALPLDVSADSEVPVTTNLLFGRKSTLKNDVFVKGGGCNTVWESMLVGTSLWIYFRGQCPSLVLKVDSGRAAARGLWYMQESSILLRATEYNVHPTSNSVYYMSISCSSHEDQGD